MTGAEQSKSNSWRRIGEIVGIIASGLAINWISDSYTPAAVAIYLVLSVGALLLFVVGQPTNNGRFGVEIRGASPNALNLLSLALWSFVLVGLIAGAIGALPFIPEYTWTPEHTSPFNNYHLFTYGPIVALGLFAAVRQVDPVKIFVFITAACSGATVVLMDVHPSQKYFETFLTAWIICLLITLVVRLFRQIVWVFRDLLGLT